MKKLSFLICCFLLSRPSGSFELNIPHCAYMPVFRQVFSRERVVDTMIQIRASHHINTAANEYFPCFDPVRKKLYFTGMDRTGFFEQKIDFTRTRNCGGEDIFVSNLSDGLFTDAVPVRPLNTNAHESVNQVLADGSLLLTGNYPENIGPPDAGNGSATTDLFLAKPVSGDFRIVHFEEPVNSLFSEMDGYLYSNNILLFASDRPGHVGAYHKKGWLWQENYWGNTDIYVAFKENGIWNRVLHLGMKVNTPYAERTPYLSPDGLTLFISSNGFKKGRYDQDIYKFTRTNVNNWTDWKGPERLSFFNSEQDDWGFKEYEDGLVFFARSTPLGFTPTARYQNGTGFVFETNYRSGYEVTGAQAGSFKAAEQTDIFFSRGRGRAAITLPDILFEFDQAAILSTKRNVLAQQMEDLIEVNQPKKVIIQGHTDLFGDSKYNMELSLKRAETIKKIVIASGFPEASVIAEGKGSTQPLVRSGDKAAQKVNRRVEIIFIL